MSRQTLESIVPEGAAQEPYPSSIERAIGPLDLQGVSTGFHPEVLRLCPIGVFDSGLGGLSVVEEIRRILPGEDIIYYADSANCPYGGRSDEWLRARSLEITDFLLEQGAKIIVVACNTASAAGLEHIRALRKVPVVGLVPAVKPAVERTRSGVVGVLATPAAIRGRLLADVIERFATPAGVAVVKAPPEGMVEAVERGDIESEETRSAVRNALAPMLERGADTVVLGCTHYPFLKPMIRELAGEGVAIIDSGQGVARQTRRVLDANHLLGPDDHQGTLTLYTSANPDVIAPFVEKLVGAKVEVLSSKF